MACWCGHRAWHYYGYEDEYGPPPYAARRRMRGMGPGDGELRADVEDLAQEIRRLRQEVEELRRSRAQQE